MVHQNKNKDATGTASKPERRKHWRDRRMLVDRRSIERQSHAGFDCRSGVPRRESDLGGELADGEVWWQYEEQTR